MRLCKICNSVKALEEFPIYRTTPTKVYHKYVCLSCELDPRNRHSHYYAKREEILAKARKRKEDNPAWALHAGAKSRAKAKSLPFDIEVSDITVPEYCPVLGLKLELSTKFSAKNSPSLDRIVPELGYTKGNIWVISSLANLMKAHASPEELLTFADWITKTYRLHSPGPYRD